MQCIIILWSNMVLSALHLKEHHIYFDFDLILKNLPSLLWWKVFYYKKRCRKKSLRHNALELLTIWGRRSMIEI